MQAEVHSLRAQLNQIRLSQSETWLNDRRVEEVKSLVRKVLADAYMRASMVEGGATAGHNGKNFYLANDDGSFLLKVGGQIQGRHIATFHQDSNGDDGETGFVIRRAKLAFSGHVSDPRVKYGIQLAVDRGTNTTIADKIVIPYAPADNLTLWAGEDKAPFLREELISSNYQLAVERSFVNEVFTLDKVQGIGAILAPCDAVKIHTMWHDGMHSGDGSGGVNAFTQESTFGAQTPGTALDGTVGTNFDDDRTDLALAGRIDIKIAGDWRQAKNFTSWPDEGTGLFLGAALSWEVGETGDGAFNNNAYSWTVDGSYENAGVSAYLAGIGQHTDLDNAAITAGATEFDQESSFNLATTSPQVKVEASNLFSDTNIFDFDTAVTQTAFSGGNDTAQLITGGLNWYFSKHAAKFTTDVVWALDPLPLGQSGLGLLTDAANEDDQVSLRTQFQLLF